MATPAVLDLYGDVDGRVDTVAVSAAGPGCGAVGAALPWAGARAVRVLLPGPAAEVYLCYRRGGGAAPFVRLAPPLRVYGLTAVQPRVVGYNESHALSLAGVLPRPSQGLLLVAAQACEGTAFSPISEGPGALIQSVVGPLPPGEYAVCYFASAESPAQELQDKLTVSGIGTCRRGHVHGGLGFVGLDWEPEHTRPF